MDEREIVEGIPVYRQKQRERERVKTGKQAGGFTLCIIKCMTNQNFTFLKILWVLLEESISVLLDTSGHPSASYFAF